MKKIFFSALISSALALSAQAVPINTTGDPSEPNSSLYQILGLANNSLVQDAYQLANAAYWSPTSTEPGAYLIIEVAGYKHDNEFGIFDKVTGTLAPIFYGSQSQGESGTFTFTLGPSWNPFGFYLQGPGGIFYSDPSKNGGDAHMVAFSSPVGGGDYVLAWEDLPGLGDRDYNDLVVSVKGVTPVPDGGMTLALLGMSMAGVAYLRRKLA